MRQTSRRPRRTTRLRVFLVAGIVVAATVVGALVVGAVVINRVPVDETTVDRSDVSERDYRESTMVGDARPPHRGMPLVVVADTAAAAATRSSDPRERVAAEYLAGMPTAVWLTPEDYGITEINTYVTSMLAEAKAADAALTLVVYGLPERDCGQYSAGGLAPADYRKWTDQIARALATEPEVTSIVILEPDSLALSPDCGDIEDRVIQLRAAADELSAENTWIYLDGGHSDWLSAGQMAGLLRRAGVDRVRGFATNVSNYNTLAEETAYAHTLSRMLGGAHAVIDTARSGAGSDGQWCNPPGRLVGPGAATAGDETVDLNLWIKPPGESDGECNGAPPAGDWWPQSAIELTQRAVD